MAELEDVADLYRRRYVGDPEVVSCAGVDTNGNTDVHSGAMVGPETTQPPVAIAVRPPLRLSSRHCSCGSSLSTAGRESLSGGALPPLLGGVLSAVRCHRRIDAAFRPGARTCPGLPITTRPRSLPSGHRTGFSRSESESRPLVTRCLAASPAIAPREARLVTSVAALHEGSREPLGAPPPECTDTGSKGALNIGREDEASFGDLVRATGVPPFVRRRHR